MTARPKRRKASSGEAAADEAVRLTQGETMDSTRATEIAADIIKALPDDDLLIRLQSDEGLTVGDAGRTWLVWLLDDSDVLAVWAGNDVDPVMDVVVEVEIGKPCASVLYDYGTGDAMRLATWVECARSLAAAAEDGGRGVFVDADGGKVYVA